MVINVLHDIHVISGETDLEVLCAKVKSEIYEKGKK